MSDVPQEVNDKEAVMKEAAMESDTILSSVYLDVKKWYNEQPNLVEEFGEFPMFWQELQEWTPWNEIFSRYMKKTDANERQAKQAQIPVTIDIQEIKSGKRKSGWGTSHECYTKRSKWCPEINKSFDGLKSCIAYGLLESNKILILQFRLRIDDLINQSKNLDRLIERELLNPNRPPSPPPVYDNNGNKTNSLKSRILERLNKEKELLMQEVVKLNPLYELGYQRAQLTKKVYIPYKEHPDCNFMGLLIGPRGQTLQKMEMQTGCKITVRGKGSLNGKRAKPDSSIVEDDDELHVFICGDTQDQLNKAEEIVNGLLHVDPARWEEIKTKQLRSLARMNGTLKDEVYCKNCGNPGHQEYECPTKQKPTRKVDVRCTFCGDHGHITKDCKFRSELSVKDDMDKDYKEFIRDLGEFDEENINVTINEDLKDFDLTQPNFNAVRAPINFGLAINQPSQAAMQNMPMIPPTVVPGQNPGIVAQINPMLPTNMMYMQPQWQYPVPGMPPMAQGIPPPMPPNGPGMIPPPPRSAPPYP